MERSSSLGKYCNGRALLRNAYVRQEQRGEVRTDGVHICGGN